MEMGVPNAKNEDHQYASNIPGDQPPNNLQHPNPMYPSHTQDDTDPVHQQNSQDPNPMYSSHTQDDTAPMHQQNTQYHNQMYTIHTQDDTDLMYQQHTEDPTMMYTSHTQDDTDSMYRQNTQDPNPMYTLHTQDDTDPMYQQNSQDPNPTYTSHTQDDTDPMYQQHTQYHNTEPASRSASSEGNSFNRPSAGRYMANRETSVKTAYSDDDPYIQPYATYRGEEADRDDSEINPTRHSRQTEAHSPASVSEDSNVQGTHPPQITGRPRPMHVQNPPHLRIIPQQPPYGWACRKEGIVALTAVLLVASTIAGIIAAPVSIFKMNISGFGTTYTFGYPFVDTTYTIAQPAVDTTHTTGHPSVDTSYTTAHPAVDSTYTNGHPAVDSTYTTGHPAMDTTYTTAHPAMDSTYTTVQPAVDINYTTAHPAMDTTYTTVYPAMDTTYTIAHPAMDTTYTTAHPAMDTTYTTAQLAYTTPFVHTEGVRLKSEKVTFISNGFDWTQSFCGIAFGVAVSADNEIFLPDSVYQQVKVFNMEGVLLRVFPTVVPGKIKSNIRMSPVDVTIDESGYLWVVGSETGWPSKLVYVVKYSHKGRPISSFHIPSSSTRPTIAVSNNNILLSARPKLVHIFSTDGRLHRAFQSFDRRYSNYITSDSKGHIIVAVWNGKIRVYNRDGRLLLQFSGGGSEKVEPYSLKAIRTNSLDQIAVANFKKHRVDMFTSRGEFIRTVVNTPRPTGIAIGPEGQLVVTNDYNSTVTIFPRQTVIP
ncbi:hypothetical protein Bbelb_028090 [Branchiostoma belcheri]|nr:hypothetical protein Bbelb_028090 [Branchiostoma belcheri]